MSALFRVIRAERVSLEKPLSAFKRRKRIGSRCCSLSRPFRTVASSEIAASSFDTLASLEAGMPSGRRLSGATGPDLHIDKYRAIVHGRWLTSS